MAFVPHRMLAPASVDVPHKIDCPFTLVPQRTDSPNTELVPQPTERVLSNDSTFGTRTTFPLRSNVAVGDIALPNVAGAGTLLAKAALMSR